MEEKLREIIRVNEELLELKDKQIKLLGVAIESMKKASEDLIRNIKTTSEDLIRDIKNTYNGQNT